jgi:hypothetical protein
MSELAIEGTPVDGKLQARRSVLEAERDHIHVRMRARQEEREKDEALLQLIRDELHRLDLLALVGVPGGVQLACRYPPGSDAARLNDRKGTLEAVRRTKATVDFGDGMRGNIPLKSLLPADRQQGLFIPL